jgi:hypothetical protein
MLSRPTNGGASKPSRMQSSPPVKPASQRTPVTESAPQNNRRPVTVCAKDQGRKPTPKIQNPSDGIRITSDGADSVTTSIFSGNVAERASL